ncbi:hypothetical protein [Desulforhabdus sp. TSK]|uniref:hypothetical protein n=1 Tax=Desulforhabdus sp. TSK TaxID=2925014 RepID=UPI001FC85E00|nr:hypothetical protein [Desulforhabdus sp. TSK]GKT09627.1 hypothetical protein DSTSK_29320 [Desulforhabdus sp. TSK]
MRHSQAVKVVGASGQISLGKQYAGQTVLMEQVEEGVWLLKIAKVIPDSELWIHAEPKKTRIDQAISWARENPPKETDLETLSGRIS